MRLVARLTEDGGARIDSAFVFPKAQAIEHYNVIVCAYERMSV
jgi:hypothetical protein